MATSRGLQRLLDDTHQIYCTSSLIVFHVFVLVSLHQPYPVDPYSVICDDHTYIHAYIHTYMVTNVKCTV